MTKKKPNEILKEIKKGKNGMRRLLVDDLRDDRIEAPRPLARSISEYMEGMADRPVFGIHKCFRLAEHYLHRARNGRQSGQRFIGEAEALCFDVRAVITNLVNHYWHADGSLRKADRERLRADVVRLAARIEATGQLFGTVKRVVCPCCRGTGRVFDADGVPSAIKAVLDEAVAKGRLGYSKASGYYGV